MYMHGVYTTSVVCLYYKHMPRTFLLSFCLSACLFVSVSVKNAPACACARTKITRTHARTHTRTHISSLNSGKGCTYYRRWRTTINWTATESLLNTQKTVKSGEEEGAGGVTLLGVGGVGVVVEEVQSGEGGGYTRMAAGEVEGGGDGRGSGRGGGAAGFGEYSEFDSAAA